MGVCHGVRHAATNQACISKPVSYLHAPQLLLRALFFRYATAVCEALGVPLEALPMQKPYWDLVSSLSCIMGAKTSKNNDVIPTTRTSFS